MLFPLNSSRKNRQPCYCFQYSRLVIMIYVSASDISLVPLGNKQSVWKYVLHLRNKYFPKVLFMKMLLFCFADFRLLLKRINNNVLFFLSDNRTLNIRNVGWCTRKDIQEYILILFLFLVYFIKYFRLKIVEIDFLLGREHFRILKFLNKLRTEFIYFYLSRVLLRSFGS